MDPRNDRTRRAQAKALRDLLPASQVLDYPANRTHARQGITKRDSGGSGQGRKIAPRNIVERPPRDGGEGAPMTEATTPKKPYRPAYRHDNGVTAAWVTAVGRRLQWVRLIVSASQREAGLMIGASQSSIASYETGHRLLPPDTAVRAAFAWGITTDFLYRGLLAGVRQDVAIRLAAQHPELLEGGQPLPPPTVPSRRAKAPVD